MDWIKNSKAPSNNLQNLRVNAVTISQAEQPFRFISVIASLLIWIGSLRVIWTTRLSLRARYNNKGYLLQSNKSLLELYMVLLAGYVFPFWNSIIRSSHRPSIYRRTII